MALGTHGVLVVIWHLVYITGITSFAEKYRDPTLREVVAKVGVRQSIECPDRSLIKILFPDNLRKCGNEFYLHYAAKRCSYTRSCELPRFESYLKRKCPPGIDSTMRVHYHCERGREIIRMTNLSPSESANLFCPFDSNIRMVKATRGKRLDDCHYKKAFHFIDESCRYKKQCKIDYGSIHETSLCIKPFGGPMEIDYVCENNTVKTVSALKGESLTLQCSSDHMLDIKSANYTSGSEKCHDPFAEATIMHRCSTKTRCDFPDDVSKYFMNMCSGGNRRLEVAYSCIKIEDTKKFIVFQDGMLDLTCDRGHLIQIVSAKYGNDEHNCWSITTQARLAQGCEGKTVCCASANDTVLGVSKCPMGVRKSLTVIYHCIAITNLDLLENAAVETHKRKQKCQKIRFELAASFGRLTSDTIKSMDQDLLVMIGGSLPILKEMTATTFDDVIRYMSNIDFLTLNQNSYMAKADAFNNSEYGIADQIDRDDVKFQAVVWYRSLVGNRDILSEAQIDIDQLSDLVTTVSAPVNSLKTSIFNREGENQTVVDMAILRFPDYRNPFFLVYNIRLTAWWKTSRLLFFEKARSGMSGQFRSMKFFPNREYIRSRKKELIDKALKEVDNLFNMPEA